MIECRQTQAGWWIVTTPLSEAWRRFSVVSPHGLELKAFSRLEAAEGFAEHCAETGLGLFRRRQFPPRRFSAPRVWMVGVETYHGGGSSYVAVSPDGVVMEEFCDRYDAEVYVQQERRPRDEGATVLKSRFTGFLKGKPPAE